VCNLSKTRLTFCAAGRKQRQIFPTPEVHAASLGRGTEGVFSFGASLPFIRDAPGLPFFCRLPRTIGGVGQKAEEIDS